MFGGLDESAGTQIIACAVIELLDISFVSGGRMFVVHDIRLTLEGVRSFQEPPEFIRRPDRDDLDPVFTGDHLDLLPRANTELLTNGPRDYNRVLRGNGDFLCYVLHLR